MIDYAIAAARSSNMFSHVIVSTDDTEVAEVSRDLGAEVPFSRPSNLADDLTPTVPVIAHAISELNSLSIKPTHVCCIYPCNPFICPTDLADALDLMEATSRSYAFTAATYPSPIQRALKRHQDGTVEPFFPEYSLTRTQDLEPSYFDAGQFYWGRREAWLNGINVHLNGASLVIPESRVVDIDTPEDWNKAELLYTAFLTKELR